MLDHNLHHMKKRKILLLLAMSYFLIFVSKNIYWYVRKDCTNLSFVLSNHITCWNGENTEIPIEVYIDNKLYFKDNRFSELYLFIDNMNVSIGYHHLKVVVDSHFVETEGFFVFPIKWITIECWGEGDIENITLGFSSSPPGLM